MKRFKFNRLERHRIGGTGDSFELSYQVPHSPSGKQYMYSPNPEAVPRLFLIGDAPELRTITPDHQAQIRLNPGSGEVVCPYSGYTGPQENFIHPADRNYVQEQARHDAISDIQDNLRNWARDFNRRQPKGGLISMRMEHKRGHNPAPIAIREDLLRNLVCDVCSRIYGVYAIGLFCPDCGAPNVQLHFRREVELIHKQIEIAEKQDAVGDVEFGYRLMGNAHEDVLTAFEATLKAVYIHLARVAGISNAKRDVGNDFQNLERARQRFLKLGINPFDAVSEPDLDLLMDCIQKRHVIGHNLGIADDRYLSLAHTEESHQAGESVQVLGEDIGRFAEICLWIIGDLERALLPYSGHCP